MSGGLGSIFSQNTLVPIGFAVTAMGAVVWLVTNIVTLQNNVGALQTRVDAVEASTASMVDRMARMETKLDLILDTVKTQ